MKKILSDVISLFDYRGSDTKLSQRASSIIVWDAQEQFVDYLTMDVSAGAWPIAEGGRETLNSHILQVLEVIFNSPRPKLSTGIPEGLLNAV